MIIPVISHMIPLRGIYRKIREIIIPLISIFIMDYCALGNLKILRYNSPCKSLPLPPGMISRVLKRGKIASCGAEMLHAIAPSCSCHFKWLATKIAFIFHSCCSSWPLTRIHPFILQYLPNCLPRYASDRSDLRWRKMLNCGQHHNILWSQMPFYSLIHSILLISLQIQMVLSHTFNSLSRFILHIARLHNIYYQTLLLVRENDQKRKTRPLYHEQAGSGPAA